MGDKKKKLKLIKLQSWYKTKRLNYARTITLSFWKSNTHPILTHIPCYMCSPTWETHIPSDMCSPTWETHILVICVPPPGKHISLVICVPSPGKDISLVICVPPPGTHIFLVSMYKYVAQKY